MGPGKVGWCPRRLSWKLEAGVHFTECLKPGGRDGGREVRNSRWPREGCGPPGDRWSNKHRDGATDDTVGRTCFCHTGPGCAMLTGLQEA